MIPETIKETTDGGLPCTPCSPSSTPETDAAWDIFQNSPHDDAGDPWALCSRMERERDEAIKDDEKARAYKRVLKNENARLRRMLNLPENSVLSSPEGPITAASPEN